VISADKLIPWKMPIVVVSPLEAPRNEEAKEKFKSSLPVVPEVVRGPKGEQYILRNLSHAELVKMPQTADINTPSPPEATSLLGLQSFFVVWRVLTLFLATHSYPAFQTADGPHGMTSDVDIHFDKRGWVPKTKWRGVEALYAGIGGSCQKMTEDAPMAQDYRAFSGNAANLMSSQDGVFVAKPAPFRPEINYGPPSSVPNLPGFVLPYFRGVHEPSKIVIATVMRRYFLGCFGDTPESGAKNWGVWLKGLDKWFRTDQGREIAHILFCLDITLESQAKLFLVVRNKQYLGCCILGFKFCILREGSVLYADAAEVVKQLALGLDQHSRALEKVTEILKALTLTSGMDVEETLMLKTAREVHTAANAREKPSTDEMEELIQAVDELSFSEPLWPIAADKLVKWIQFLGSSEEIPSDWPMHLSGKKLYDNSRAHRILSAFGPTAPSLVDVGGTDFDIPRGLTAPDPASEEDPQTKKTRLPAIYVSAKALEASINDSDGMIKKRRIRQNTTERAAGFRTIKFTGESRTSIWEALRGLPFEPVRTSVKRGREDDVEGGNKKKKAEGGGPQGFDRNMFL